MKVAIIGQGYVGLPLAMAACAVGHNVIGVDVNDKIVASLNKGCSPIEDLDDEQLSRALDSGLYRATENFLSVATCEIIVICLPTPLDAEHNPDLSFLESALHSLVPNLQPNVLVINESTVAPGTTRGIVAEILSTGGVPYDLAFSPERIDPSNKNWNVANTPKLLAGLSEQATRRAFNFYQTFVQSVKIGSSLEVVETAKLLENSFRLINISFINEIAQICSAMKIDVREVIEAASTKPYGFMPFYPSVGVGGHCIPVDPKYLSFKAREIGVPSKFIELAHEINLSLPTYFLGVASGLLGNLRGKRILLIGIAYKSDVADIRESPAISLMIELRRSGAYVSWHDDLVVQWKEESSSPITDSFDLVILVNPDSKCDLSLIGSIPTLNTRGGF